MRKILAAVGILVVFILGLFLGVIMPRFMSAGLPQIFNTTSVIKEIQTLSQLVTVKYVMEKVVVLDDTKWYGDSRVLLIAHGVIKAGINFEQMQPGDIKISGKKIIIALPAASVTDAYLDEHQTQIL